MKLFMSGAARRARVGTSLALVAGSLSVAASVGATPASAASFTSCPGTYTTTVKANASWAAAKKYKNTVSNVKASGTTCSNAHALSGAFARKECAGCKVVRTIDGYTFKGFKGRKITGTKGSVVVTFNFDSFPVGVSAG